MCIDFLAMPQPIRMRDSGGEKDSEFFESIIGLNW